MCSSILFKAKVSPPWTIQLSLRANYAAFASGVVWCGVVWCGVVWCGVVWCGVVWCGVVWCGVVWCGALLMCM